MFDIFCYCVLICVNLQLGKIFMQFFFYKYQIILFLFQAQYSLEGPRHNILANIFATQISFKTIVCENPRGTSAVWGTFSHMIEKY